MKHKLLPKCLIVGVFILSLFSFAYVNIHAAYTSTGRDNSKQLIAEQPTLVKDDEAENANIPVPDVTLIGRIIDIAQKLASPSR